MTKFFDFINKFKTYIFLIVFLLSIGAGFRTCAEIPKKVERNSAGVQENKSHHEQLVQRLEKYVAVREKELEMQAKEQKRVQKQLDMLTEFVLKSNLK